MKIVLLAFFLGVLSLSWKSSMPASEDKSDSSAVRLAHELLIVDTHLDVPFRLWHKNEDISKRTKSGNFDYSRARLGGLDAPFFAIYVPAGFEKSGGGKALADSLIDMVDSIVAAFPDKFVYAADPQAVRKNFESNKMSILLGIENGTAIEDDLDNIDHFFKRGVRYITLAHAEDNRICDSSYDTTRTWHGLSPFGKKAVIRMNRVGMMIDVSHITDDAFYQVIELSDAPVVATHSCCRHFTPGFERNMNDVMIKKLAAAGGVIQINFGSTFLRGDLNKKMEEMRAEVDDYLKGRDLEWHDEEAREYIKAYRRLHPLDYASVEDAADHIDHVVSIAGVDHVGLGSDFDGVGDTLPEGLKDVSGYPNLIRVLLERGYSEKEISKVCSGNILRVWEKAASLAKTLGNRP